MSEMVQQIVCKRGACSDPDDLKTEFDSLFDKSNIVDQIQHDLMDELIH